MTKALALNSTVLPSGSARDAASVAMMVPAPGRFSISVPTPCALPISSASSRARMSAVPPGANGTMNLIIRLVCAWAARPNSVHSATALTNRYGIQTPPDSRIVRVFCVGLTASRRCRTALIAWLEQAAQVFGHQPIGAILHLPPIEVLKRAAATKPAAGAVAVDIIACFSNRHRILQLDEAAARMQQGRLHGNHHA